MAGGDAGMTMTGKPEPPEGLTYEQFLEWLSDGTRAEWVNGKAIYLSPVADPHAAIVLWLGALFEILCEERGAGWARVAPFQMKTGPDLPGREPDVLYVAPENLSRVKRTYVDGPADIAVEVVSPESAARDRGEKFYEYERGGVREYWLIDPERKQAEFYQQGPGGLYVPAVIGDDSIFRSRVIEGLMLDVRWLWQEKLPTLLSVLKAWGIIT